jgi:hypothetical protein
MRAIRLLLINRCMPPLSLWKGVNVKTNDYKFIDRIVAEQYRVGGAEFWIHKYLGPATSGNVATSGQVVLGSDELVIQDALNMEIRDRKYDPDVYSLKGHYLVSDTEFDLRQFGLFLSNDTVFLTFHLNQMVESLGRRLMAGDVIEILHQRDDQVDGLPYAISKYYVVEEGTRPAEGYSQTWWPHIWRVKCNPITDSQEFKDILNRPATDASGDPIPGTGIDGNPPTIGDLISTYPDELKINDAILAEAEAEVPFRNVQSAHFYVLHEDLNKPVILWAGDGIPPNQSKPVNNGITFPINPEIGDYFLRTDYSPNILYRREQHKWVRCEVNWRQSWSPANRVLETFINNDKTTSLQDGSTIPERTNLRKAVKAKPDPDLI